jgi:hypothetical protein
VWVAVLLVIVLLLAMLETAPAAAVLRWLAASPLVTFAISACLFGLSTARRQERLHAEAGTSWLAALPVPDGSILRLISAVVPRLLAMLLVVCVARWVGAIAGAGAMRLTLAAAAGALAGTVAGVPLSGGGRRGDAGWHYAPVRRARPGWAAAPSLMPLSYWPTAQGRMFSRPSISRVMLFAMLAVPAGRTDPGQVAIAVAAGCITAFTLLALSAAASRTAVEAARWLAPTTVGAGAFLGAYLWRVAVKQLWVLAIFLLLACAVDYPQALRVGGALAAAYFAISSVIVVVACLRACRQMGLGTAGRGG